jgi:hypothetical protein
MMKINNTLNFKGSGEVSTLFRAKKNSTATGTGSSNGHKLKSRRKISRPTISEPKNRVKKKNDEHSLKSNEKFKMITNRIKNKSIQKPLRPQ